MAASLVYVDPVLVTAESAFPLAVSILALYSVATFKGPVAVSTVSCTPAQTSKEVVIVVWLATEIVANAVLSTIPFAKTAKSLDEHFYPTSLPPAAVGIVSYTRMQVVLPTFQSTP